MVDIVCDANDCTLIENGMCAAHAINVGEYDNLKVCKTYTTRRLI